MTWNNDDEPPTWEECEREHAELVSLGAIEPDPRPKKRPGRPRKWNSDADRMQTARSAKRGLDIEVKGILAFLRGRGSYIPGIQQTGRESDEEIMRNLRIKLETIY